MPRLYFQDLKRIFLFKIVSTNLQIFIRMKVLQRQFITLAQIKVGNNSKNLRKFVCLHTHGKKREDHGATNAGHEIIRTGENDSSLLFEQL